METTVGDVPLTGLRILLGWPVITVTTVVKLYVNFCRENLFRIKVVDVVKNKVNGSLVEN